MSTCLRRREFIAGLGGAAAWPLAASAQQRAIIGILTYYSLQIFADRLAAFREGLKETGFAEGQNVSIEYQRMVTMSDWRNWRPIWSAAGWPLSPPWGVSFQR
jgi:hypothetical protein